MEAVVKQSPLFLSFSEPFPAFFPFHTESIFFRIIGMDDRCQTI